MVELKNYHQKLIFNHSYKHKLHYNLLEINNFQVIRRM